MTQTLQRRALFQYSILAMPLAFVGLPLYMHAPDFYAAEVGLSLVGIGSILLFVRIFDAVQDPIIGIALNKFSTHRNYIIYASLVVMALSFYILFHPPQGATLVWFGASLALASTAFSVLSINFNAMGSLWSRDRVQKTRITSWREGVGLVGLLMAAVLPSVFGLPLSSIIFVGLLTFCGFVFMLWAKFHRGIIAKHENETSQKTNILNTVARDTWGFYGVYTVSILASAIPGVLVLFFIRDLLGAEHLTGLFLALYFISGAAGMVIWQYIAKRSDAVLAWLMSMMLAVVTFIGAYFLGAGDVWQYGVVCILSGVAFGAELALPPAILSNMIDRKDARGQTSLYFAVLGFLTKTSLALGGFIALMILDRVGFIPAAANTDTALHSLSLTYAVLPCVIKAIAASALLYLYTRRENLCLG